MLSVNADDFSDIGDWIEEQVAEVKLEVAVELDKRLARRSPVDEGQFRANWTFKAAQGNAYDETFYEGTTSRAKDRSAESLQVRELKTNDVLVSNNAPYAARLNDGWSQQAPKKFVELSMLEAVNKVFK